MVQSRLKLLRFMDDPMNHFFHCNHLSWTNRKCECTYVVQYKPLLVISLRSRKSLIYLRCDWTLKEILF